MLEQRTADRLIAFIGEIQETGLPPEIDVVVDRLLVDTIGCMVGGAATAPGEAVIAALSAHGSGPSDIIGTASKLSPHDAAYVNAYTADVLDFEETLVSHPSAVVVAAALAVGQAEGSTWREVRTAIALGYELGSRIGAALVPSAELRREFGAEFWWKPLAAVIAAGSLLRLDREQWRHAFGYATAASPAARRGGFEFRPLSQLKANYGGQAATGVLGAYLAKNGFLTHRAMLDGPRTYAQLLGSDRWEPEQVLDRLGEQWIMTRIGFKVYPTCLYLHALLEGIDDTVIARGASADQVSSLRIRVPAIICRELADTRPAGIIDAQFSAPVAVATLILKRTPHSEWFDEAWLRDPEMLALAQRIELVEDQGLTERHRRDGQVRARVEAVFVTGETAVADVDTIRGSADRPLSDEELGQKFVRSTAPVLGAERSRRALDALRSARREDSLESALSALRGS